MTGGALGPVETKRLVLRLFRESDLDAVHAFQSDPDVVRYLYWDVRTRDESRAWLQERMAADRMEKDGDALAFAVERREDGRVIGSVNAWWRSVEHKQGEIGFVFAKEAQGRGYATEAATALLDLIFPLFDLHRVCGSTDGRNVASAALMRRLGMRQEAHLRENELFKGEWGDERIFAILRHEWERRS
ncbi:MAG: acetyltransferase [Frankiales bacterium]|nr:acetyltransferase [Frankiales bacterium]